MKSLSAEPQRFHMRMHVPGGRMKESEATAGAVELGARTMQEGGAFLDRSREEVELFCIDHAVAVEVVSCDDGLLFDFSSVTSTGPGGVVTGAEAAMQVAHVLLTDFEFEEDAFRRAKQALHEKFDSTSKGLETACLERLTASLTGGDSRFLEPTHQQLDRLDLPTVRRAVVQQLRPANVEVSMAGDLTTSQMEALALDYLGTVPPAATMEASKDDIPSLKAKTLGSASHLSVFLQDSDERAVGYLAGAAPNNWGIFHDGRTVADLLREKYGGTDKAHRAHPLFGHVALLVLQELANRRLFSVVREERQLTYDATFQTEAHDSLRGGWYLVSVTSSPAQVNLALEACKDALSSLRSGFGVSAEAVSSAKRTLLNQFLGERGTCRFWAERLSGSQSAQIPLKTAQSIADFEAALQSVTAQDVQQLAEVLDLGGDQVTLCAGIAAPHPPVAVGKRLEVMG